jgi:hypothetical protein
MSVMSKSTRSDDHPPDRHPIPTHTRNTVEKGMVLPGYGNPIPVPVPVHTRDRIIMVLPIPMSLLSSCSVGLGVGGVLFGVGPVGVISCTKKKKIKN